VKFKIVAFKAIHNIDLCKEYAAGHLKVLEDYGITNVTSNNHEWFFDDSVYGIVVFSRETGEIVGGARLHVFTGLNKIPLLHAIGPLDPKIEDDLMRELPHGTGEACGLWNAKKAWGLGLSALLTTAIVAFSGRLGLKSIFALSAKYTKEMILARGFEISEHVGDKGDFVYPIESHRATVMIYRDLMVNLRASEYERSRIESLRKDPIQTFPENINNRILEIEYNLSLEDS
jgi:hypothetical protein